MAGGTQSQFAKAHSMRRFDSLAKAMMAACMVIAAVACGPSQRNAANAEPENPPLDSLRATVLRLIDEPLATSIGQCRLTAFGAKPCGGPRGYLVYSVEATDSIDLARVVELYRSEDARLNRVLGRASDCALVAPPQITFTAGQCTTGR